MWLLKRANTDTHNTLHQVIQYRADCLQPLQQHHWQLRHQPQLPSPSPLQQVLQPSSCMLDHLVVLANIAQLLGAAGSGGTIGTCCLPMSDCLSLCANPLML